MGVYVTQLIPTTLLLLQTTFPTIDAIPPIQHDKSARTMDKARLDVSYSIDKTWDGAPLNHSTQIRIRQKKDHIVFEISAPFYNDPPPPGGKEGEAYFKLWEHEVVEAFFLNEDNQYLEVEFGPHGQHLLLLLDGERNAIRHSLPVEYSAQIDAEKNTWKGESRIPVSYFPPNITRFNAYAIHGSPQDRRYEALYEVSGPQPDFHFLAKFKPFPHTITDDLSDIWKMSIEESKEKENVPDKEFEVGLSWDGASKVENPARIALKARNGNLEISIVAPFYDDPAPPGGQPGQPYFKLWDYEVVEAFFLNGADRYLELEFGPYGQHLMLLLDGQRNAIKHSLPLEYSASIDEKNGLWTGKALIPESYLPPNVTSFNGYAIHGTGDDRTYEAVFEVSGPQPDFHRIEKFGALDLTEFLHSNARCDESDVWKQALAEADM